MGVNKSTPLAEPRTCWLWACSHPLLKPLSPNRQKLLKAGDRSLPRAQDSSHLPHSQHRCHTITDFIPRAIHLEDHFTQAGLHQHHRPGCVCPQTGRCQLNHLHNPSPLSTAFIPRDRLLLHLQTSSASTPVPGKSSESITRLVQYLPWTPRLCGTAQQAEQSGLLKGFHYNSTMYLHTCSFPYALKLVKGASWDYFFFPREQFFLELSLFSRLCVQNKNQP